MKAYPYRQARWSRGVAPKPLAESCVAIITTAAFTLPEQTPFDVSIKGGDYSYRWLPGSLDVRRLETSHRSHAFDREGVLQDANLAFPLDRLREMAAEGLIGTLHEQHLSFMGSITAPGRLIAETAPEAARALRTQGVDLALLVPV